MGALIGASLIPDAALLNIGHPIYSYFWLQHVAPAGIYAVAIAGAALILTTQGVREGRRLWLVSGVILAALVALFKVYVFTAAFPLLLCFCYSGLACAQAFTLACARDMHGGRTRTAPIGKSFLYRFGRPVRFRWYRLVLEELAAMANGTPVETWYRVFGDAHAFPSHLPQAIGLMLLNGLGVFAILAPACLASGAAAQNVAGIRRNFGGSDSYLFADDVWFERRFEVD